MNKEESMDRILELQRDLMLKDIDYNFEYIVDKRIKELQQENKQLKDNWNKLRDWASVNEYFGENIAFENNLTYEELLNKIEELEKGDSNE